MRHESSPISEMPPTLLATNGVPQASDSLSTFGSPSDRLGKTVRSAARYQSGSSSWSFGPRNVTRGARPRSLVSVTSLCFKGPSPTR